MTNFEFVVAIVVVAALAAGISYVLASRSRTERVQEERTEAQREAQARVSEAETAAKQRLLEAQEEALRIRTSAEEEARGVRQQVQQLEARLIQKEENLERRSDDLTRREQALGEKNGSPF